MASAINRLSARFVETCLEPGKYADGGNLYLVVGKGGGKSWLFIYRFGGKQREAGLGALEKVSLKTARAVAGDYRALLGAGVDPLVKRDEDAKRAASDAAVAAANAAKKTFGVFALDLLNGYAETDSKGKSKRIPGLKEGFRNRKHAAQWETTLREYAAPLWDMKCEDIEVEDVLKCVAPLWTSKNETGRRVRGRIETVLAAAIAKRLRRPPNPAVFKGNLEVLLPRVRKLQRGHHPALDWRQAPTFWAKLCETEDMAAKALRFAILTGSRSGEARGATWGEIDLEQAVWSVPAPRMKGGRPHVVPLSDVALALLAEVEPLRRTGQADEVVFPGPRSKRAMADMSLLKCAKKYGGAISVHGFRSTLRDWCGDETMHSRELAEQALAHHIGGTEGAYRRSTALEKRRGMMTDWANYVTGTPVENVVPSHPEKSSRPSANI